MIENAFFQWAFNRNFEQDAYKQKKTNFSTILVTIWLLETM